MNNKNVNIFLHFHTFGSVKQYIFPVNEETSSPWKNNPQTKQREKKKSAHEQPSATSHHLPAAWNTDSEGDAAGSGRSQKAAQLPFTTTSPVFSGGCLVPAHERPALPSDLTHTVTDAFFIWLLPLWMWKLAVCLVMGWTRQGAFQKCTIGYVLLPISVN